MATDKTFSMSAFVKYGNECINNQKSGIHDAFVKDFKTNLKRMGNPGPSEMGIVDQYKDWDMSNTLAEVPNLVSGFMHDEKRSFNIPAADKNTAPATLKVVAVDKKVDEGTIQFGENKGKPYKTVTAAHEEIKVKSNRDAFKK